MKTIVLQFLSEKLIATETLWVLGHNTILVAFRNFLLIKGSQFALAETSLRASPKPYYSPRPESKQNDTLQRESMNCFAVLCRPERSLKK